MLVSDTCPQAARPGVPATPRYRASSDPEASPTTPAPASTPGAGGTDTRGALSPSFSFVHGRSHRVSMQRRTASAPTDRCHEQRPRPQRGHPGTQVRKLPPQHPRRVPREPVRHRPGGPCRLVLDDRVHVIRHHPHSDDLPTLPGGLPLDQLPQAGPRPGHPAPGRGTSRTTPRAAPRGRTRRRSTGEPSQPQSPDHYTDGLLIAGT
jgi:hypothetical protein